MPRPETIGVSEASPTALEASSSSILRSSHAASGLSPLAGSYSSTRKPSSSSLRSSRQSSFGSSLASSDFALPATNSSAASLVAPIESPEETARKSGATTTRPINPERTRSLRA